MTISKPIVYVSAVVLLSAVAIYGYYQSTQNTEKNTVSAITKTEMSAPTISQKNTRQSPDLEPAIEKTQKENTLRSVTNIATEDAQHSIEEQELVEDEHLLTAIDKDIEAAKPPMLWEALSETEDLSHVKISAQIQGAEKIKLNQQLLKKVVPGDQIQLPVLAGDEYTVNIEKVDDNKHNVNIRGHIEAFGSSYLATITQGEKLTFATISTPNGTYDLRLVDGKGWVYDADQLNAHIDTTKPDTLLPPDDLGIPQ